MLFLAGDIGGTNGHVALMRAVDGRADVIETLAYRVYPCAAFPSLAALLRTFIDAEVSTPVSHAVLACAGQVMGDDIANDNLPWPIQVGALRTALGLTDVAVLNDFEALAYAIEGPLAASGGTCAGLRRVDRAHRCWSVPVLGSGRPPTCPMRREAPS